MKRGADGDVVLDAGRRHVGDEALHDGAAGRAQPGHCEHAVTGLGRRAVVRPRQARGAAVMEDEEGEVLLLLPRPQRRLLVLVAVTHGDVGAGLPRGRPDGGVGGEQERLVGVGRHHEGGAD